MSDIVQILYLYCVLSRCTIALIVGEQHNVNCQQKTVFHRQFHHTAAEVLRTATERVFANSVVFIMTLSAHEVSQLRVALQDAVVRCSERCLYQSSKWLAASRCHLAISADENLGPPSSLTHFQRMTEIREPAQKLRGSPRQYTLQTEMPKRQFWRPKNSANICLRSLCLTVASMTAAQQYSCQIHCYRQY